MDFATREPMFLSLKAISDNEGEERIFEGYASTEALDSQNEVVLKSALTPAIEGFLSRGKITYNHDRKQVIGKPIEAYTDEKGLRIKGFIARGSKAADEVWALMKQKVLDGLSLGFHYDPQGFKYEGKKRVVTRIKDIFECTICGFPSNPESYIDAVKSQGLEFAPELAPGEAWVAEKLAGADDEWRAVAKSACELFGARGGCDLDEEGRKVAFGLLGERYAALEKEPPEFEGEWPESFKLVSFKSNEKHIYEEETAGANLREIARRAADVQSIAQHWAKEGLQLSEATRTELGTAIKSLEALQECGAPPEPAQGDAIGSLLKSLAGGK